MELQYIPNALCVFRIVLIVPLVYCIMEGRYVLAFLLFGFAGFTDGLDGFLARHFNWRTRLGGFLDPLADKALMFGVFLALTISGLVPLWLAALVIGRDVVIMLGGLAYRYFIGGFEGDATMVSKVNTALLLLFGLAVLANAAFGVPGDGVSLALGGVVMVSTVVSGLDYVRTWGLAAWRRRAGVAR